MYKRVAKSSITHVSDTAFLVARYRANESARPDALFNDPFAAKLAGTKGRAVADALITRSMTGWSVSIRTVVIDDLIRDAIANGADTILNLGTGLDARPYRLDLPKDLGWIEADYPDVIAYKTEILGADKPRCRLERVSVDLADATQRRALLDDVQGRSRKLVVLTEGVVPYLDQTQVADLADDLRVMQTSVSWIVDYFAPEVHAYRRKSGVTEQMSQAPFKFQPDDYFGFFAKHGWRTQLVRYLGEQGRERGRPAPLPWNARLIRTLMRYTAPEPHRSRFDRLLGYVVLEPGLIDH